MAEIRQYNREKKNIPGRGSAKTPEEQEDFQRRIQKHRKRRNIILITAGVIIVIGIFLFCLVKFTSNYRSYSVVDFSEREDSGYAQYLPYGDGYVKCTKDGVAAYTYSGTPLWNRSFEIDNISTTLKGEYLAVADINGNEINLFDTDGYVVSINTTLPIVQMSMSEQGLIVAILKDKDADYVNMYDTSGDKIYSIKTTLSGTGIPISAGVSEDGEKLIVAFSVTQGTALSTSVVFYSFDEVGQNETSRIVGGFDSYGDQLVSNVLFLTNTKAVAFSTHLVSFFQIKEYPELLKDVKISGEIKKVFTSDSYVGIVYGEQDQVDQLKCNIYSTSGKLIFSTDTTDEYTKYLFAGKSVMMYNDQVCRMLNLKGEQIFKYTFKEGITSLIPITSNREYLYVNSDKISKIKLK